MYIESNTIELTTIRDMVEELNKTNSSKEKQECLKSIYQEADDINKAFIKWALKNTYSPYIKFGVTSDVIKKYTNCPPRTTTEPMSIERLLALLAKREITGHKALDTIHNVMWDIPMNLHETLYNIIDKNLKIRMDAKSINKVIPGLIPEFSVSLCNVYADKKHKVDFKRDNWLASRKLDGCISGDTLIAMADGSFKPIQYLFDTNSHSKVLTFNEKTGKIEKKKIKNCFKNEKDISCNDFQWYEIELSDGRKLKVTGNHKIYIPKLKCYRRVDELIGNEEFYTI